jgi:sugar lactone lactonase YvrE
MFSGRVLTFDPVDGSTETVLRIQDRCSGLGWLPSGELLVVSMSRRQVLRFAGGEPVVHADLTTLVTGDANDMVVDGHGRAYVGNFGYGYSEGLTPQPTNLICVEPDGAVRTVADSLLFPNGAVITPSGQLVVAEGFASQLTSFRIERNGDLTDRTVFASLGGEIPDGIALDAEGGIWVALPLRQEFIRVLQGGVITDRISVSPRGAFACALGGEHGRTLFMMATLGDEQAIAAGKSKGEILAAEVAVGAAPRP